MRNIYLIISALLLLLFSCTDDDNLDVDLVDTRYTEMTQDDKDDVIQHYIHDFYNKTGVVIVKNPEPEDYKYNYTNSNKIDIVAPAQTEAILQSGIDFINEIFVDYYKLNKDADDSNDYDFIKSNFPFTIQLADTIKYLEKNAKELNSPVFCSSNLVVISGINEDLTSISAEKKRAIQAELNSLFWQTYMVAYTTKFRPTQEYFDISKIYYNQPLSTEILQHYEWFNDDFDDFTPDGYLEYYKLYYTKGYFCPEKRNIDAIVMATYPNLNSDVEDFFKGLFLYDHSELMELCNTYPLLKRKYDVMKKLLMDNFKLDISDINKSVK